MRKLIFIFGLISLTACTKENEKIIEVEKPIYPESELISFNVTCCICPGGQYRGIITVVDGYEVEIQYDTIKDNEARFNTLLAADIVYKDSIKILQYQQYPGYPFQVVCENKFYRNGNTN